VHSKPSGQRQKKPEGRAHSDGNAVQVTDDGWRNADVTPLTRVDFVYNGPKGMELAPNPHYSGGS